MAVPVEGLRMTQKFRVVLATLFVSVGLGATLIGSPSQARADNYDDFADAIDCSAIHGFNCAHVVDAKDWAIRVTTWKFPGPAHNNMGDAFRHCAWMGALAKRVGQQGASTVGIIHE